MRTLIETAWALHPGRCCLGQRKRLYLREPAGRAAYFPFDIDRIFWEVLCADHLKILRQNSALGQQRSTDR
jgi:hypothetical protein